MGIFSLFKHDEFGPCTICGSSDSTRKLTNGFICDECIKKCGCYKPSYFFETSSETVNKYISANIENDRRLDLYSETRDVCSKLFLDENNRLFKIPKLDVVFSYDEILDFKLLKNGDAITKCGLGRAVVGGALFGGVGAVVGGVTGKKKTVNEITVLKLNISIKHAVYNNLYISFIGSPVKENSLSYRLSISSVQDVSSELARIIDICNPVSQNEPSGVSAADEILKFKELFDQGIITQDEFALKKKQLLDL